MAKGMADYLCEQSRQIEGEITRDIRKSEHKVRQKSIKENRNDIELTDRRLQPHEESRGLEPSAMFYLLKRCGGVAALDRFDFCTELKETAETMGLTVTQTAAYILVAGLQRRCPCGVGAAHLARYTGEEPPASAWRKSLSTLYRLGLLSIAKQTDKGITYYKINAQ